MVEDTGEAGGSTGFEESRGPGDLGVEPYSCPHLAQRLLSYRLMGRKAIVADGVGACASTLGWEGAAALAG